LWKLNIQNKREAIMSTDERMEKMEGQLARIRWINRCLIACIVLSLGVWFILKTFGPETAWAGSGVKVIRANAFVLEDENGKVRATLGLIDGVGLSIFDEDGRRRAALGVDKERSKLQLLGDKGNVCIDLKAYEGVGELALGGGGRPLVILNALPDDTGLCLYDEKGKQRLRLGASKIGAVLAVCHEDGRSGVRLVTSSAGPEVTLFDKNGRQVWSAP
jgi:hypothetical protein